MLSIRELSAQERIGVAGNRRPDLSSADSMMAAEAQETANIAYGQGTGIAIHELFVGRLLGGGVGMFFLCEFHVQRGNALQQSPWCSLTIAGALAF